MESRTVLVRFCIAAAVAAVAAPASAQPSPGTPPPYEAAKARVKKQNDKGVYYGQQAPRSAYPFIVALVQSDSEDTEDGNYSGQYCAGSLIADRWVITAAQCVITEDNDKKKVAIAPEKVDIYAGSTDFKDGKRIKVKRVILHPQYNGETNDNDIALLELEASAASSRTKTIALATPQNEAAVAAVGKKVIAAGWGETETKDLPQALRHVEMDILDSGMCNTNIVKYRQSTVLADWARTAQVQFALSDAVTKQVRSLVTDNPGKLVNDNMVCSGRIRTKRDTCSGDFGGPLFVKGSDGRFTLVGLTSWGEGCGQGDKNLFGIYTRVSRYGAWVQQSAK